MVRVREILSFWFEGVSDSSPIDRSKPPFNQWFARNPNFDETIRKNFEEDYHKAVGGEYRVWEKKPQGCLALILIRDQFSRNMFRDSPKMFSADPLALALSTHAIREGMDAKLNLIERAFLYMPFMHAENKDAQKSSIKLFQNLVKECTKIFPANVPYYEYTLSYAYKHRAIIERFGRFSHRNTILGRISTADELEFLAGPGSAF
jgi:uncharacterized protein (DUF924 family)